MKNYSRCPICEESSFSHFLSCKDYTSSQETFELVQCNNCSFVFTNPIPDEKEMSAYYESDEYISHSNTSRGLINSLYQFVRKFTIRKKVNLVKSLGSGKSLLDIGSGTGEFLYACQNSGLNAIGIEPSSKARENSIKKYQLSVYQEDKLTGFEKNSFDFISMWHVLEHVYHLNERIETLSRILKNDGHLIVAVPNRSSYDAEFYKQHWAAYDVPRHLYHFTPSDIKMLFEKHQFQLVKTLPMKFDSFYVSLLSEKYRQSKAMFLGAIKTGFKSNLKATKETYSSQIYILKKLNLG